MTVSFSDREYQFSHGKAPRGRGWWLFQIGQDKDMSKWFGAGWTLAEAKKAAKEEAAKRFPGQQFVTITILP